MREEPNGETAEDGAAAEGLGSAFDPSGLNVLAFARNELQAGRRAVVATLSSIHGSSPRRLGAQMAIAEDGEYAGSISSGCLERAIVDEARAAIGRAAGGIVRYGEGSKYLDIALPCGSGVDILYTVGLSLAPLNEAVETLQSRRPFALSFSNNAVGKADQDAQPGWNGDAFVRVYQPPLQIVAAGVGAELIMFSRMAAAAGHRVIALSPDAHTLERCAGTPLLLRSSSSLPALPLDPWTAFISLFHDREWEAPLLMKALSADPYYIGAVGSPRTHDARLEACRAAGVDADHLPRVKGPVGLIPSTRDPSALAISVLAEIIGAWPH